MSGGYCIQRNRNWNTERRLTAVLPDEGLLFSLTNNYTLPYKSRRISHLGKEYFLDSSKQELLRIKMCGKIICMNKMIARTALVATLAISAMSLTACGSDNNDCAHAVSSNTVTATTATFPARSHGHSSHSSSHGPSTGGFHWFWMGGSHSEKCPNPAPTSNS